MSKKMNKKELKKAIKKVKVKAPAVDAKKKPKKYLTNKNLLAQIHLSKKTYCWFYSW